MQQTHHTPRFVDLAGGESLSMQNISSFQLIGGDATLENKQGQTLQVFNGENISTKFYHHTWEMLQVSATANSQVRLIYTTVEQSPSPTLNPSFYQFSTADLTTQQFYRLLKLAGS